MYYRSLALAILLYSLLLFMLFSVNQYAARNLNRSTGRSADLAQHYCAHVRVHAHAGLYVYPRILLMTGNMFFVCCDDRVVLELVGEDATAATHVRMCRQNLYIAKLS